MTHLRALDLTEDATPEDVARAYRTLVKVWHPDRFAHDPALRQYAQLKLQEINVAHAWLESHPVALEASTRDTPPPKPPRTRATRPPPAWPWAPRAGPSRSASPRTVRTALAVALAGSALVAAALIGSARITRERSGAANEPSRSVPTVALPDGGPPEPAANPATGNHSLVAHDTFSLGASRAEVVRAQGTPTRVEDWGLWIDLYFGRSSVKLKNERVVGYVDEGELRVELPTTFAGDATGWWIGSSLDEVVAVEGTPAAVEDWNDWMSLRYGRSTIRIEEGRVTGYDNRGELDVRLVPGQVRDSADWALGSPLWEVLSVQGTPTAFEKWNDSEILYYGRSHVRLRDDRVVSYDDREGNLVVRTE